MHAPQGPIVNFAKGISPRPPAVAGAPSTETASPRSRTCKPRLGLALVSGLGFSTCYASGGRQRSDPGVKRGADAGPQRHEGPFLAQEDLAATEVLPHGCDSGASPEAGAIVCPLVAWR